MTLFSLYQAIDLFLSIISWAILAYCVMTWVAPRSGVCLLLARFISPFVSPFQRLAIRARARWNAPFDFTCLFALIGIRLAGTLIRYLFFYLMRL